MARAPLASLSALLLAGLCRASAADNDFPWAAEARALAPEGWVGGQVIGFDAAAKTGVVALYPKGDDVPTTHGRALEVRLDGGAHPIRSSATLRDRRPAEHVSFRTSSAPSREDEFQPASRLPRGATACSIGGWTNDPDPGGLNLRAEPSARSRIVAKLPHPSSRSGIEFQIIGYREGWFLIEHSENPDYEQTAPSISGSSAAPAGSPGT